MSNRRIPFNHSQRLGLDIDRHIALDAGAGTGKTTVMAERYVQHLIASIQRSTLAVVEWNSPVAHLRSPPWMDDGHTERTSQNEQPALGVG